MPDFAVRQWRPSFSTKLATGRGFDAWMKFVLVETLALPVLSPMSRRIFHILAFGLVILGIASSLSASDRFQGDWEGSFVDAPVMGRFLPATCFAHVIVTGEDQYRIVMRADAHERADPHFVVDVTPDGDRLAFATGIARGVIQADRFSGAGPQPPDRISQPLGARLERCEGPATRFAGTATRFDGPRFLKPR